MRRRTSQRGQMRLVFKPWHGVVGLGLQKRRLDPPFGRRQQPGIRPRSSRFATSEVMNTVLPDRAKPGDAQPDHRLEKGLGHGVLHRLNLPPDAVGNP